MDTNAAASLGGSLAVCLGGVDNGHAGSTTALVVLDDVSASLARRSVLAGGSIVHAVVEFQVAVKFS